MAGLIPNRTATHRSTRSLLPQLAWWTVFVVCVVYALAAFQLALVGALSLLGLVADARPRGAPVVFVVHALAGGVGLLAGPLQLNRQLLQRRALHRAGGRVYVWAIWTASLTGLWVTLAFDVSVAAKVAFGVLTLLWFSTTTLGYLRIRQRAVAAHRAWMIRSVALSLFFVTFSLWMPGLAATPLPQAIGYPLSVFLSWSLNLLVAEIWIRRSRAQGAAVVAERGKQP
jgi:hypothetical protein